MASPRIGNRFTFPGFSPAGRLGFQLAGIKHATKRAGAPEEEHTIDRGEASILFGWWSKEPGLAEFLRNRWKQAWESEVASCGEGSRISSCSR